MAEPRLVCLLPARNASAELPGWFESVEVFADAVVALDDGSTDDTAEVLASHPKVTVLLRNPRRESYHGWDDAANRNRLLEAAGDLGPAWVFSLDADERLDRADGEALRAFAAATDPDPSKGYLLRVYRMIGNDGAWDHDRLWVGRLFAHRAGQRFPDDRLHFVALPADIRRDNYVHTTLRIQHLASTTEEKRRLRHRKYAESDPHREFQPSYDHLLDGPGRLRPWVERPPDLPFELHGRANTVVDDDIAMSVVVISQNDRGRIVAALDAIVSQRLDAEFEVILVNSGVDGTAELARDTFPEVRVIHLDRPALPGEARNAGLAVARGTVVTFPGSHVRLEPGALQHRLDRHREGWAMVSGSMANGTPTWAGWANFFLDHSAKLPGRPAGPLRQFPATSSYLRRPLCHADGFPDLRAGEDTLVNESLWRAGYGAFREPRAVTVHDSPCVSVAALLRHHNTRGIGLANLLSKAHDDGEVFTRAGLRQYGPRYVAGRLLRIVRNVRQWGDRAQRRHLFTSLPLVVVAAVVHWTSGWVRFLRRLVPVMNRPRQR